VVLAGLAKLWDWQKQDKENGMGARDHMKKALQTTYLSRTHSKNANQQNCSENV
jgi:hypothetical protein